MWNLEVSKSCISIFLFWLSLESERNLAAFLAKNPNKARVKKLTRRCYRL